MKDMTHIFTIFRMALGALIVWLDGGYCIRDAITKWSDWSDCSANCGGGFQTRTVINSVDAANAGSNEGTLSPTIRTCNQQSCEGKGKMFNHTIKFTFRIKCLSNLQAY